MILSRTERVVHPALLANELRNQMGDSVMGLNTDVLIGFFAVIGLAGLVAIYYLIALIIRLLAELNLFWTYVKEGTVKAIMQNGRFAFCIMSFANHIFKSDLPSPPASMVQLWDIVDRPTTIKGRSYLPFLRNIRWIGF